MEFDQVIAILRKEVAVGIWLKEKVEGIVGREVEEVISVWIWTSRNLAEVDSGEVDTEGGECISSCEMVVTGDGSSSILDRFS